MPSPDFRLAETGESAEAYALRCAKDLEKYVSEHHHELAAFILEPLVQCAAGMGMYHSAYLRRAREICSKYEVHLIADEIAVGFGRTGTMFACEQAEITADFICLSKGITGGYLPLSVVLTRNEIYQAFYDDSVARGFLHSHSYTGNPLACSAALATLAIFETDNILQKNREKSVLMQAKMQVLTDLPIKHLRHQGMIFAFDVETRNKNFSRQCYQAAISLGLLLRPIGNTVYWMPPYTITETEINFMVETTVASMRSAL
jgi:adenosylmethionine-8-amino-7-oxononanoate aminotransferase